MPTRRWFCRTCIGCNADLVPFYIFDRHSKNFRRERLRERLGWIFRDLRMWNERPASGIAMRWSCNPIRESSSGLVSVRWTRSDSCTAWWPVRDNRKKTFLQAAPQKPPNGMSVQPPWLSDRSSNRMVQTCPITEWFVNWMVTWIMDKKSGNWTVIRHLWIIRPFSYRTFCPLFRSPFS